MNLPVPTPQDERSNQRGDYQCGNHDDQRKWHVQVVGIQCRGRQHGDRNGCAARKGHGVVRSLHGIRIRLVRRRDDKLDAVADRNLVGYRRQRDRHVLRLVGIQAGEFHGRDRQLREHCRARTNARAITVGA